MKKTNTLAPKLKIALKKVTVSSFASSTKTRNEVKSNNTSVSCSIHCGGTLVTV